MSSLDNLHVTITLPIAVDENQNAWRLCTIADLNVPEWNNDSAAWPLARFSLNRDITLLQFFANARNGHWNGAILLKRTGDGSTLVKQVALRGSLVTRWFWQKSRMSVDETHDGKQVTFTSGDIYPVTKELLLKYGVPVMTAEQQRSIACPTVWLPPHR